MVWKRKKKPESEPVPPPPKEPVFKYHESYTMEIEEGTGPVVHRVRADSKGENFNLSIGVPPTASTYHYSTVHLTYEELEYIYNQMREFKQKVDQHGLWGGGFESY